MSFSLKSIIDKIRYFFAGEAVTDNKQSISGVAYFDANARFNSQGPAEIISSVTRIDGSSEFFFKEDILDQLEDYFTYILRMKKTDPDSFGLYSKIGGYLLSDRSRAHAKIVEPAFMVTLPAFGCIFAGSARGADDFIHPAFVYFNKLDRSPSDVQSTKFGSVYKMTVYHDKKTEKLFKNNKCGLSTSFYVNLMNNGTVLPLRQKISRTQIVCHHGGVSHRSTKPKWEIVDMRNEDANLTGESAEHHLVKIFTLYANFWSSSQQSMIRVAAKKRHISAIFGVDILSTPNFFKDRNIIIESGGYKKKIFHIVRTHMRNNADGSKTAIKSHFRGLREFIWNGYNIKISVPFRDHKDIATANITGVEYEGEEIPAGFISKTRVGEALARALH